MKFSIIVTVYNTAQYLDTCIASVKNQKFSNWELIAIDDGSSDGSGKLLDRYAAEDNRIRVFHQNNRGQFYARQKGIEMAEGDYLLFLDSDDQLTTDSMEMIQETVHKKIRISSYIRGRLWSAVLIRSASLVTSHLRSRMFRFNGYGNN